MKRGDERFVTNVLGNYNAPSSEDGKTDGKRFAKDKLSSKFACTIASVSFRLFYFTAAFFKCIYVVKTLFSIECNLE